MKKSKTIFIKGDPKNVTIQKATTTTTDDDTLLPTPKQKPKGGDKG